MSSEDNDMNIPDELLYKIQTFQQDFEKMSEILKPLHTMNINSTDYQLDPLDRARLNLVHGYALNSLFWMYLNTLGIDPKEHKIKGELDRYKSVMARIKEIADKSKAPTLDKGAAKRFVRNALWEPKDSESENTPSSPREPGINIKRELSPCREKSVSDKNKRQRY